MTASPFGIGVSIVAEKPCSRLGEFASVVPEIANDLWASSLNLNIEHHDAMDCDPVQTNFARLFCDLHCVRDAVIRGDMTINRNLKSATDITKKNMEQLAKWNVDTLNLQAGHLASKIDYVDTRLGIMLD